MTSIRAGSNAKRRTPTENGFAVGPWSCAVATTVATLKARKACRMRALGICGDCTTNGWPVRPGSRTSDCKSVTSSATAGRTHLSGRWSRYKEILMATVNADILPANTLGDTLPAETTNRNRLDTPTLIITMLSVGKGISDLIFSPGRPPQVERHGELTRDSQAAGAAGGRHGGDRERSGRQERPCAEDAQGTGRVRPVVLAARARPLPRQHLPAARDVRDRDARHRHEDSDPRRPEPAGRRSARPPATRTASCWSPARPARASRRRSPR